MRRTLILLSVALTVALGGYVSGIGTQPLARAASGGGNGEFIVRCPMTGEVQAIDPIMAPGAVAPHVHMFFGNTNVQSTSTYQGLHAATTPPSTTCEDQNDTAAYWAPESFMPEPNDVPGCIFTSGSFQCPYLPGCQLNSGGSGNYTCGTNTNNTIYIRAYYLTGAGSTGPPLSPSALPAGLIMVAGTPDATSPPANDNVVEWDCGANTKTVVENGQNVKVDYKSPESIWPYDCSQYENDPNLNSQGLVEIIDFPSCWNGLSSYPTPNGHGPGGKAMVPGYFDPSMGSMSDMNDLAYPPCTGQFDIPVPHVSMRIHYINLWNVNNDEKTVYPSSCDQIENLSEACQTEQQAYGTTGAPADIGLDLSSTQTGGKPGPWYTEHADYWQTWQQGDPLVPNDDPNSGNLNSLTYYCLDLAKTCSFVPNAAGQYPPTGG